MLVAALASSFGHGRRRSAFGEELAYADDFESDSSRVRRIRIWIKSRR
ncbi:hypothetical protein HMPREF0043_00194 [Actinobaculum sp. oral taxon 183 str. F0552]|nr:hypothetical protein HMPREF0043_00194 [Actinobaculum sp. oral taxon 183 str. F0552]